MKKIIEFIKNNKLQLLTLMTIILFFRGCNSSRKLTKLERNNKIIIEQNDSLKIIVESQKDSIRSEKIKIHSYYDNWITQKNRSPQLMELHLIIKNNLKELQESK